MKYFLAVVALLMLVGCKSEIDKCVDAEMKAWRVERSNAIKHNELHKNEIEEAEAHNKQIKEKYFNPKPEAKPSDGSRLRRIDADDIILFDEINFKAVNKRTVDITPEEVVEADKRRMCIQLLK